jgi:5-enolpyruvylshikimate-3-phosphate synthase
MDISVTVKNPGGTVKAITSKSHAHRHLICSALSDVPNFVEVLYK